MKKAFGIILASIVFALFVFQVGQVLAKHGDDDRPVTSPITSPITSPLCKPGYGFGDKNHCHSGPPGQEKNDNANGPKHK